MVRGKERARPLVTHVDAYLYPKTIMDVVVAEEAWHTIIGRLFAIVLESA